MQENKKILELLLSTLDLIIIRSYEKVNLEYQLEELEGDYYTFLHKNNMDILLKNNIISEKEYNLVLRIREKISHIQSRFWNPSDFLENAEWLDVRKETVELLELLKLNSY